MPLLESEPNVIVANLLVDEWQEGNIDGTFETGWIGTGWWDEDSPNPQITLTGVTEDTSPNGIDPSGKGLTSWVDGTIDCNIWSPAARENNDWKYGENPKKLRFQLLREVHRIIENNQTGTTDESGNVELTRLETGTITRSVEEGEPTTFRALIPIGYQFHTRPE